MPFDTWERSLSAGRPVRLYEFIRGAMRWLGTGADRDITWDGRVFRAMAIGDDGVRQSGDLSADTLTVTVPADWPPAALYRLRRPATAVELTVRDLHAGDNEARVAWVGSVVSVTQPDLVSSRLQCQSLAVSLEQPGLRLAWERGCPHALFDRHCGLAREAWQVQARLVAVDGVRARAPAFALRPDGWFAGGFVQWDTAVGVDVREIDAHAGDTLTLTGTAAGLVADQIISAWPGCARTLAVCGSKFANTDRYGGIPHLPGKSPFDGTLVF